MEIVAKAVWRLRSGLGRRLRVEGGLFARGRYLRAVRRILRQSPD